MTQLGKDLNAAMAGQLGSTFIDDTELHVCEGEDDFWVQVTVTADARFDMLQDLAGRDGCPIEGALFLHNLSMYGQFKRIKLREGAVICQRAGLF